MSLSATTLIYNCPASTGTDSITGLAFAPKAIKVTWTLQTADGSGADFNFGRGFACNNGGTQQACFAVSSQNGGSAGNNNPRVTQSNAKVIYFADYTNTAKLEATVTAWNGDGITFTWATVTSGVDIQVTLYGGTDITNVFVGMANASVSTAPVTQNIVAPTFQPDYVELMLSNVATDEVLGTVASFRGSIGRASSTNYSETSFNLQTATSSTDSGQRSDVFVINHAGAVQRVATMSITSTGFSLAWTQTTLAAHRMYYLCIKGGNWKVGTFNQATSTGAQAITGLGFLPTGVELMSWGLPQSVTINTSSPSCISIGSAISSSVRNSIYAGITASNRTTSSNSDSTKVLKTFTPAGASPTLLTAADFTSLDASGFTINNTTTDATSREISYVAFGSIPVAGPTITFFTPIYGIPIQSVVITGTNFGGATAVTFNGTAATFNVDNANQITAAIPTGATTGAINVTTPAGNVNSSNSFIIPTQATIAVVEKTTKNINWSYVVGNESEIDGFEIQTNTTSPLGPWTTVQTIAPTLRTTTYAVTLPSVYLRVVAYLAAPLEESPPDEIFFLDTSSAPPIDPGGGGGPGPGEGGGGSGDVGQPPGMTIISLPSVFTFGSIYLESGKVLKLSNYVTSKTVSVIKFCTHPTNGASALVFIGDQTMTTSEGAAVTLKGPNQQFTLEDQQAINAIPLSNISITTDTTGSLLLVSSQTS